jgi:hypothetical protein
MLTKKESNMREPGAPSNPIKTPYPEVKKETPPSLRSSAKNDITKVVIKYNVGFGNQLFIRGTGANLSWDKGILLNNISADEWVWETKTPFNSCEFKVLVNDFQYELGENHRLDQGSSIQYVPRFFT